MRQYVDKYDQRKKNMLLSLHNDSVLGLIIRGIPKVKSKPLWVLVI